MPSSELIPTDTGFDLLIRFLSEFRVMRQDFNTEENDVSWQWADDGWKGYVILIGLLILFNPTSHILTFFEGWTYPIRKYSDSRAERNRGAADMAEVRLEGATLTRAVLG